ncbi:HIT family protein [Candidatus Pacebacteria bacterium]|nr:HIT family protein [Candidatus Paceibacterota bacterium]
MAETIFTKIINREIPGHFVYEDDVSIVILDKFPTVPGQSLVIPKQAVDYIFDLDEATYQHLFAVAKKVARASDKALATQRTCLVVEGFDVPHVHIKIYPLREEHKPLGERVKMGEEADDSVLSELAAKISAELN